MEKKPKRVKRKPEDIVRNHGANYDELNVEREKFVFSDIPKKIRNSKYMSDVQIEYFRKILEEQLKDAIERLEKAKNQLSADIQPTADSNDAASIETETALIEREHDRVQKLIRKINATFKLIDSGDYGYCKNCNEEIGLDRLKARPVADLCIDCKTIAEKREKNIPVA